MDEHRWLRKKVSDGRVLRWQDSDYVDYLFRHILNYKTFTFKEFQDYLTYPEFLEVSQRIIWMQFDGETSLLFRITSEHDYADITDSTIRLTDNELIRYKAILSIDEQPQEWVDLFLEYNLVPMNNLYEKEMYPPLHRLDIGEWFWRWLLDIDVDYYSIHLSYYDFLSVDLYERILNMNAAAKIRNEYISKNILSNPYLSNDDFNALSDYFSKSSKYFMYAVYDRGLQDEWLLLILDEKNDLIFELGDLEIPENCYEKYLFCINDAATRFNELPYHIRFDDDWKSEFEFKLVKQIIKKEDGLTKLKEFFERGFFRNCFSLVYEILHPQDEIIELPDLIFSGLDKK